MEILVVDDHALFREGLHHVLNQMDTDVTILEASNFDQAIKIATENLNLDLVLLDLNLPGKDGFSTLDAMTRRFPALTIVILSASSLRHDVERALEKGAAGFIHKDTTSAVMLNALKMILSGGVYVPPAIMMSLSSGQPGSNAHGLTPRQLEVLSLLVEGHSNKAIATRLGVAEATVKMHVTAILQGLEVSNRTQAVRVAEKLGLIQA